MIEIGFILEARVEGQRVLGLAHVDWATHHGNYVVDLTPPSPHSLNLSTYAKSCVNKPIRVDNPINFIDASGQLLDYSIGVKP